jgi:AAA+ ATPase superfamily predicted ATPase
MFIVRGRELNDLKQRYENGMFEFAVIYGHRRVGKTIFLQKKALQKAVWIRRRNSEMWSLSLSMS